MMLTVRKGKKGEEKEILDVANKSFIPFRKEGFDFVNVMPKVYDNNLAFSACHHVVYNDDKMVATAGNLINKIDDIKYSVVGSVATLPMYSGQGCMKLLMQNIEQENRDEKVTFSVLTGVRKRYNYYGYEQGPVRFSYHFNEYFIKHLKEDDSISLKEANDIDLDAYYALYKTYQPLILRDKKDFTKCLLRRDAKILGIYQNHNLIGYLVISLYKNWIEEISLEKLTNLDTIIAKAMKLCNINEIDVLANALDNRLIDALDKIACATIVSPYLNIKIYDLKKFLSFIISLNLKTRKISDLSEVYKVDDKVIEITIKDNVVSLFDVNKPYLKEFTSQEFVRYIFNVHNNDSHLFPLFFDINEGDLF